MSTFDLRALWTNLDHAARQRFALTAQTSVGYLKTSLVPARKIPRPRSMSRLIAACKEAGADVDEKQLYAFFFDRQSKGDDLHQQQGKRRE